jgi:hypothetical protein
LETRPFLKEVAFDLHSKYRLEDLTIVFPNRRAILYFRKHLSDLLDRPAFSPAFLTIEELFQKLSPVTVPDKLELIHRLYRTYHETIWRSPGAKADAEPFDRFFFWGDMLLRDFDEVDRYLLPADLVFKDLSNQKELDTGLDYLTEEQRKFLTGFWKNFESELSENEQRFLTVWQRLYQLYTGFREQLQRDGLAYEGMSHRMVVEKLPDLARKVSATTRIVFTGFNALTKAEEALISFFVESGRAEMRWDMDAYYVNNNTQEAGKFFREYQQHPVLGATFSGEVPSNFKRFSEPRGPENNRSIRLIGAPEPVGQAKIMAQILEEEIGKGIDPEDTVIVLPDEKLLLPVLHGVSGVVDKLNITMGFPYSSTPAFNMVEIMVEMQIARSSEYFNHRQVLALLGHPYVVAADAAVANSKRKEILNHNWVHVPFGFLATTVVLHRQIFRAADVDIVDYLYSVLSVVGELERIGDIDREYTFHFLKLLNRMREVMVDDTQSETGGSDESVRAATRDRKTFLRSFLRLFRQLVQSGKIPFSGEPLKGLQIMGVLETRNLDYRNVFILSMNEGAFPTAANKGSYIPYNIRRAYGLPTVEHQDAIYAYLFYRAIQRAENVFLFFNSETDVLGQGEMSRFLQQLIYESGIPVEKSILHNPILPTPVDRIVVPKDDGIMEKLVRLNEGNARFRGISPSTLNTYLECRLRFYLRHIARIKEPDEIEEDLDARVFGTFVHEVMESFYKQIVERVPANKVVTAGDLDRMEAGIQHLIDQAFIRNYHLNPDAPVQYEGQRLVVREVVKRFVSRIIEMDREFAPFTLEAIELGGLEYRVALPGFESPIILGGKVDRVDRKDNMVRVIDYKTGKDQLDFESIPSLFIRDNKRNKAAFQTILYAMLFESHMIGNDMKVVPGLINRMSLFDRDFQFGFRMDGSYVDDIVPHLTDFKAELQKLLAELFDRSVPFDQTDNVEVCRFCAYRGICYR